MWTNLTLTDTLNPRLFHFQVDPSHKALGKHSYSRRCATKVSFLLNHSRPRRCGRRHIFIKMLLVSDANNSLLSRIERLTRTSHRFSLSSVLDSAEYVQLLASDGNVYLENDTGLNVFTWLALIVRGVWRCENDKTRRYRVNPDSFNFPLVPPHPLLQTPLHLAWPPEVCGEQQRVSLLQ